ncbi:MAG TPA: serine/threonine-protein kinase [Polyangia bacterium]|nr:serine/threonine-protein kinase [Polyangia bacterium]
MRASDLDVTSLPQADPAPTLARGTALGRFLVLGLVGRGGMGEVYGAYDPDLDRKIAIKLLRARGFDAGDNRARLMREAKATAKISHPNVVVVYDAGTFGDRVFIAMEFVEGHTLRYWLQAQERTWIEVLDAFLAAGRGLAAAHDKELVHRDFKPDNVMVAGDGQVRVMDFGLARMVAVESQGEELAPDFEATMEVRSGVGFGGLPFVGATPSLHKLTATGAVLGTPAYMSPEQFRSQPADARSDQFSFCVALHEALFRDRPFAGRSLQELADNVVAGRLSEPDASRRVPAWVRPILARGLSTNPDARFPSMDALLDELARHAGAGRTSFARGAAAKLAGVWEAPAGGRPVETPEKIAMREAFLATGKPYAAAAFATASAALDRYAQRWSELYVDVCEATHVRGEQSAEVLDLRMTCLNEGLDDLRALCRLFREATAQVVENAVKAADALGTLERCNDVKLLRALVRPPEDAATRAAVEQVRQRLVDVRALERVGRTTAALEAAAPLAEEARRAGYGPMLAEVLLVYGVLQLHATRSDAVPRTLEDSFHAAVLARHDEAAASAAIHLIYQVGYLQGRFDVGEIWTRYAETLLRRLGGHDLLWGWLYSNRANMREQQGRLDEAVEDARLAIAAKERALGPRAPDVARSLGNLGNHLAFGGDFLAAIDAVERAIEIFSETVGADHPATALVLANKAQFLCRLSRFDDARAAAKQAIGVFERETDPRGLAVTAPLRTLGLCDLGQRRFAEARPLLERAVSIREAIASSPLRLAEVHAPLARALYEDRRSRARGLELARRARDEYARVPVTPVVARDIAELDAWLAKHDARKPSGRKPKRPAPKVGARKTKRRASG